MNVYILLTLPDPGDLQPSSLYFIENGDYAETYITSESAVAKYVGNTTMIEELAGAAAYTDLTDAITVDLPTVNTPLSVALGLKADTSGLGTAASVDADQNLGTGDDVEFGAVTAGELDCDNISVPSNGLIKSSGINVMSFSSAGVTVNPSNFYQTFSVKDDLGGFPFFVRGNAGWGVGIGTNNPAEALDVVGNIAASGTVTAAGAALGDDSKTAILQVASTSSTVPAFISTLPYKTNSTEQLRQRGGFIVDINEGGSSMSFGSIGLIHGGYVQAYKTSSSSNLLPFSINPFGGNVGIGVGYNDQPAEALDVRGNIAASGTVTAAGVALVASDGDSCTMTIADGGATTIVNDDGLLILDGWDGIHLKRRGETRLSFNSVAVVTAANLEPSIDLTHNCGSDTKRWATTYTGDLDASGTVTAGSLDIDNTSSIVSTFKRSGSTVAQITGSATTGAIGLSGEAGPQIAIGRLADTGDFVVSPGLTTSGVQLFKVSQAGCITLHETTVGTLPDATTNARARIEVTDALAPVVGSTVAAGGAAQATVRSDGTNWVVIELL